MSEAPEGRGRAWWALGAVVAALLVSTSPVSPDQIRHDGGSDPEVDQIRHGGGSGPGGLVPAEVERPPDLPQLPRELALQPQQVAPPAPSASAAPAPAPASGPVAAVTPGARVDGITVDLAAAEDAARHIPGVAAASGVLLGQANLGGGSQPLVIAGVDPATYRAFTPQITAEHVPVWERLADGDAAVTHEVATTMALELGASYGVGPTATPLRIGAFASNGTPPLADALVDARTGASLGLVGRTLVLAVADGADPTAVANAVAAVVGGTGQVIEEPRQGYLTYQISGEITPENVWDHLALCESSGNWSINTGNGYYGGLQFLPESWYLVGGTGLPHEHTREEQIYRATLLWHLQGWEAWPQCARKIGLIPTQ